METKGLNFLEWLRTNTLSIEKSENLVYEDKIYTENELWALYKILKVTEVDIRGFDGFFSIELRRREYLTLEEVMDYVRHEIIETATVIKITHKTSFGDLEFRNYDYVPPTIHSGTTADKYLKK